MIVTERGFAVGAVHGDLRQGVREQALRAFRNVMVGVLVATDVAARGIDVDNVANVISYECPDDEKTYLHHMGRTGRAGNSGVAVTLVNLEDTKQKSAKRKPASRDRPTRWDKPKAAKSNQAMDEAIDKRSGIVSVVAPRAVWHLKVPPTILRESEFLRTTQPARFPWL